MTENGETLTECKENWRKRKRKKEKSEFMRNDKDTGTSNAKQYNTLKMGSKRIHTLLRNT